MALLMGDDARKKKAEWFLLLQWLFWKEYENYVKLHEKELSFWENTKDSELFQKLLCLATTNVVSVLILALLELFSGDLVNWEPQNSKYGNAVGQGYFTLVEPIWNESWVLKYWTSCYQGNLVVIAT